MSRKSKPIPFSDNEKDILQWAESRPKPFATYVKELIRADMNKNDKADNVIDSGLLKETIKEVIIEMGLGASLQNESSKVNKKKSDAISRILGENS